MATPIYGTPNFWYLRLGTDVGKVDPKEALALEIYNQLYGMATLNGTSSLAFTTDGTGSYTNTSLIGKTISAIFISSMLQTTEYSFDIATGVITWTDTPDTGIDGLILYY